MILRKPYGFLIKHFKIINLILLIPILYTTLKFGDISSFFRDYVSAKYTTAENMIASNYITVLLYLVLIFLIATNLIIYFLMKNKKKPTLEYGITTIYYLVLLGMTIVFYNTMISIEMTDIDATIINLVRDLSILCPIPSYAIIILTFLKGIGFNISTFRFDNNMDLQITDEDEAEFELKVGTEGYIIKRNFIHSLRELKYYILENKFVFTCIGIGLVVVIGISIFMNFGVYNKRYNLNQTFALDNFSIAIKDSYISNVDYSGKTISKGKYYLAVKIFIQNNSQEAASIDKSNFRIYIKDKIIYPSYDRSSRFIDIGNSYQGNSIRSGKSDTYVLVYEIDKSMIKKSYKMKILSALTYDSGELIPSYKIINIKPNNIVEKENLGDKNLKKEINLNNTLLGNTKYKLNSIEFAKKYNYTYEQCITNDSCSTIQSTLIPTSGKTLVIIEDDITYDKETSYYKNSKHKFYEDFASIKFDYTGSNETKELITDMKDVTPNGIKDKKIYEVSSLVLNSENKRLILTIRNKELTINLDN